MNENNFGCLCYVICETDFIKFNHYIDSILFRYCPTLSYKIKIQYTLYDLTFDGLMNLANELEFTINGYSLSEGPL